MKRRKYHLEVCPGESLQGPTDEEIVQALKSLPGGTPSFVILTKGKHFFMQAGGSVADGFSLEYEEFSSDGLWEHPLSEKVEVPFDVVASALVSYANDNDDWRSLPWKRLGDAETQRRQEKVIAEIQAETPQPGFFGQVFRAFAQIALEETGLIKKSKRPRR